jgi:hypothetical protein
MRKRVFQISAFFWQYWGTMGRLSVDRISDIVSGTASVKYASKAFSRTFTTEIMIYLSGFSSSGKIALLECERARADKCHLDFLPRFQRYQFDEASGALTISGRSPKMRGAFKVTIIPLDGI